MSILRTYNVQNPDSASVNIELSPAGGIKVVGVSTIGNTVVGGGTTQLIVTGDARITGILTIGTSSVTLDGTNNQVNVGTGVTIHHTNGVQVGGNTVHSTGLTINQINVGTGASISSPATNVLSLGSNNTERLRIDSSGSVGIGTNNPGAKLHLSSGTATQLLISNTSSTMNSGDTMGTVDFTAGPSNTTNARIGGLVVGTSEAGGDLSFETRSNEGSLTEKVRITGIGSVGIGTNNPEYPFELYAANSILQISSPGVASDNYAQIVFKTGTSSQRCWIWKNPASNTNYGGSESFNFWQGNNAPIAFFTNGTNERVRISGIGTITLRAAGGASIEGYNADDNLLPIAKLSRMGYSTGYRNLIIGKHLPNSASYTYQSISLNYDPNTNPSGSFTGYGNEIFVPNNNESTSTYTSIVQPNTSNNGFNALVRFGPSGQVLHPNQPAFRAYLTTEWTTNNSVVNSGWTENFDRNNNFNQGTFTAPVAGIYSFGVTWDALNVASAVDIKLNGNNAASYEPASSDGWETNQLNTILELSANDYVQIYLRNASGSNPLHMGSGYWGWFCGYLIA